MAHRLAPEPSRQRSALLRRVYEDNLRLRDGPTTAPAVRNRPEKRLAILVACIIAVALAQVTSLQREGDVVGPPHFRTAEAAVGPTVAEPTALPDAGVAPDQAPIDPPAYGAPLGSGDANIKKLFGLSVRTIVVDAGHGGRDPGTIGTRGLREKDVTLDVARRLKEKLEHDGIYRILLVRDGDVTIPLSQRVAFANSFETDLFVSIHVNYLPGTSTNAVETYYFGAHPDSETRKLAERENEHSEFRLSEFESVLRNLQDTIKLQESARLAHAIQRSLLENSRRTNHRVLDTGVKPAPFVVLLGVKAPSVLAEIASLSSAAAERDLEDKGYRDDIASYLASGIRSYLDAQPLEGETPSVKSKSNLAERQ